MEIVGKEKLENFLVEKNIKGKKEHLLSASEKDFESVFSYYRQDYFNALFNHVRINGLTGLQNMIDEIKDF